MYHAMPKQVATLGGGCFWCTEAIFSELKGVISVEPGYSGGTTPNPTYEQVCTDRTGHAEVVQVVFDSDVITYRDLLRIFFSIHDPTQLNRQGEDVGTQYRSIILYHDEEQRRVAEEVMEEIKGLWDRPIVTQLVKFERFYPAEEYHRNYFRNNPERPYCRAVISPKVYKFRKQFTGRLKV
ncbi:MAG: peptide-methionine (S)-S-oxide reductase MsrA [Nitrososphaeria archaeon]